eukprot:3170307-Pyramimonas_sp.AAC.1
MILDCVSLYRKLRHPVGDAYHFLAHHDSYKVEKENELQKATVAEVFEDHMSKAASLAALFSCQPSGGAAVQGLGFAGRAREDGCAQVGASFDEMVPYWTEWCPTRRNAPKSTLGALPFA